MMHEAARPSIEDLLANPRLIEDAVQRAMREAVVTHARLGHRVATWREGKVVWLEPAEVLAMYPSEPAATQSR
jgi:hypothetical protein